MQNHLTEYSVLRSSSQESPTTEQLHLIPKKIYKPKVFGFYSKNFLFIFIMKSIGNNYPKTMLTLDLDPITYYNGGVEKKFTADCLGVMLRHFDSLLIIKIL